MCSISNRTFMQDIALDIKPDFYNYSQSQKLNNIYKKSLIKTKSVDFNVPLQHSNNKRGKILKDIRPKETKIYKNSIKDHLIKLDAKIR